MWIFSLLSAYFLIGLIFGFQHMTNIYDRLTHTGKHEKFLRDMVAMYELTPKGAEYYTKLQNLYIQKGELIDEYKILQENETRYQLKTFLFGFFLWPYYAFSIKQTKTAMKREMER